MSDEEMLAYNFFADDKDCDGIRNHTARVVKTRRPQVCMFTPEMHVIPAGSRARVDKAVVDGEWKHFYSCEACHDRAAAEAAS